MLNDVTLFRDFSLNISLGFTIGYIGIVCLRKSRVSVQTLKI